MKYKSKSFHYYCKLKSHTNKVFNNLKTEPDGALRNRYRDRCYTVIAPTISSSLRSDLIHRSTRVNHLFAAEGRMGSEGRRQASRKA